MALDERLRGELDRAAQPADPSGIYEHLIRRRERRHIARKVQSGLLAVVVLLGSIGGFYALTRIFRESEKPPSIAAPSVENGFIVFSLPLESSGEHVFVVGADGTGLRQLTPQGRAVYRSPDVSPDGRTVVVVHEIPSFDAGQAVLATVPIEGGTPTWLSEETWVIVDPTWSPDGERIAFAGSPGGPFGIYVLELASGNVRLVPGTDEIDVGDPTWSPDGSRIAFEAWDGTLPERWDIYSVRLDGSALTNLTNTPDQTETWPAWSWSTDRIAFARGGDGTSGLYTMAPDGTNVDRVPVELRDPLYSPAWSPDGSMLAFSADTGQIYTVGADGSDLRPVTGGLGEPAWQAVPDDGMPIPTPTPSATEQSPPEGSEDIGLGFPVCNVSSVSGTFGEGVPGTAFLATKAGDSRCPRLGDGFQLVAVDVSGEGLADVSFGPLECDEWCTAFATPDVDGDGTDELLIQNIQFSIAGLRLYEVRAKPAEVFPVTVSTPGYPEGGLDPGTEPQLWVGGDAFDLDTLRCFAAGGSAGRVLIQTSASQVPPDSADSVWEATATWFDLNDDGTVSVVDVVTFEEPVGADPLSFEQGDGVCGARLPGPQGNG